MEKACSFPYYGGRQPHVYTLSDGTTGTIPELCKIYNMPRGAIYRRVSNGWDIEKALTTPIRKFTRQTKSVFVTIDGITSNLQEALQRYNISESMFYKYHARNPRKSYVQVMEEIVKRSHDKVEHPNNLYTYEGVTGTLHHLARLHDLSPSMVYGRVRRGWSLERALTTPSSYYE